MNSQLGAEVIVEELTADVLDSIVEIVVGIVVRAEDDVERDDSDEVVLLMV